MKRKRNKFARVDALSHSDKMINGFAWLSIGLLLSRLIGAIYIIFWSKWIGEHYELANSLYAIAYNPYVLFIDIATAGFPLAITKQVSQLNARNEYKASMQLFKYSAIVMIILGIVASAVFYFSAEVIASTSVLPTGNIVDNISTLRTLAPTLLILPFISVLRGFFQGYQQMTTPAISQIVEQFVRVGYMLGMTYYVMKIKNGSFVEAVEQSTFAAFVGAVIALIILLVEFIKSWPYFNEKMAFGTATVNISFRSSVKTILSDSIPFVLFSTGSTLTSIIDQILYRPLISDFSHYSERLISISYAWFSANVPKLITIVGSLSAALTTASIPNIATLYQKNNKLDLMIAIIKNIKLTLFIIVPSSLGLFVVSPALYRIFYTDANGAHVLRLGAFLIISVNIFNILAAVFQSLNKHIVTLQSVSIMILFKIPLLIIATALFKEQGPIISTIFATTIALLFLYVTLLRELNHQLLTWRDAFDFLLSNIVMLISSTISYWLISLLLPEFGFVSNMIKIVFTAVCGAISYIIITLHLRLMDDTFPSYAQKIRRALKIK